MAASAVPVAFSAITAPSPLLAPSVTPRCCRRPSHLRTASSASSRDFGPRTSTTRLTPSFRARGLIKNGRLGANEGLTRGVRGVRRPLVGSPRCAAEATISTASGSPSPIEPLIPLGQSELLVSPLGIGTLQWGDPRSGFGEQYRSDDLAEVFRTALAGGVNLFDSAEVYGYQGIPTGSQSEQLLGRFVAEMEASSSGSSGSSSSSSSSGLVAPVIATKFFTIPWTNLLVGGGLRFGRQSLIDALRESLKRLNRPKVDLYQIHFPFPTISNQTLMEGLREAVGAGMATAVGVSNYNQKQLEEAHSLLKAARIPLASNQVRFNLLDRKSETSGLLGSCQARGISLIAYSPLAAGLLTDKALQRTDSKAEKIRPLLLLMQQLGEQEYGGKSVSQVALNYIITKGAIPIPGCKTVVQAESHLGSLGWRLAPEHVARLEDVAARVS